MNVYLLYEEHGEYNDYTLGMLGVFSTPDKAKEWLDIYREQQLKQQLEIVAGNMPRVDLAAYKERSEWSECRGFLYCKTTGAAHDSLMWTIDKRELDLLTTGIKIIG